MAGASRTSGAGGSCCWDWVGVLGFEAEALLVAEGENGLSGWQISPHIPSPNTEAYLFCLVPWPFILALLQYLSMFSSLPGLSSLTFLLTCLPV